MFDEIKSIEAPVKRFVSLKNQCWAHSIPNYLVHTWYEYDN